MNRRKRTIFFFLIGLLSVILLSFTIHPVFANDQSSKCMSILMEAAKKAGIKGETRNISDDNNGCFVQFVVYDSGDAITTYFLLNESQPTPDDSCKLFTPSNTQQLATTFHGYYAKTYYYKSEPRMVNDEPFTVERKDIEWCMHKGDRNYVLAVSNQTQSIEKYGPVLDPLPIADALWSLAEDRLPLTEEALDNPEPTVLPVEPEQILPEQPETPADQSTPSDSSEANEEGNLFGIPAVVVLGSLGVPIAGAMAGALISSLVSLLSSGSSIASAAQSAAVPNPVTKNNQELFWSERPWDEAGPGYVTKEEYERTQQMLNQGYKWTKNGWQTPDQIQQSNQWQQNNQAAVAQEEAAWQVQRQAEQQALRQNEAELQKRADELDGLQAENNFLGMKNNLETINRSLLEQNIYVVNPLQGDPTLIVDGISKIANIGWDITAGWVTHSTGLTCGDYVGETLGKVKSIVTEKYGPNAKVEGYIFEEKSTCNPQGVLDWFDKLNDDNHNLIKVTLPDGSEWAVDFHQHNTGKHPPILRPWKEARQVWKDYLGNEFTERISIQL
jgi:hypothetical protein